MDKKQPVERYLVLFLPWGLSSLFQSDAIFSYSIAWLGSLLIFYLSLSGWLKPLPNDRPIAEQLMRPIFLVQIIFAGYMAVSSIFYFFNLLGYEDFHKTNYLYFVVDQEKLELTVQCQRYYVLGHAAFVTGILAFMKYPVKQKYYVEKEKLANLLFTTAIITLPVSLLFLRLPGLSQFYFQFSSLSFIAVTLALAFAIPLKKLWNTVFCALLYSFNFYQALLSGFKEPIIISVLVLGLFLYPNYKKIVTIIFVPALLILFAFLPTYNTVFRANNWSGDVDAEDAYKLALDATIKSQQSGDDSNWGFLVYRLSEIDMFIDFAQSTPKNVDYYGLQLLKQSAIAVVPRAFWPSKPSTEDLVMERVYDAGVIRRGATVSAKPAFIVDAYLSGGIPGIFISLFLYGAIAQLISLKAEHLFGGYILGTALIFSGLFQIFWRGLSFEFLINSVFLELYKHVAYIQTIKIYKNIERDLKVLQISPSYKPAIVYGGPTMSISMLSEQLVRAGVSTQVFTTTANGKNELSVSPGLPVNVDDVTVTYFKRITKDHTHFSPGLLRKLWKESREFDLVHIHAWWNLVSVLACLVVLIRKVPVLLSPRGTLSPYSFQNKNIGPKWIIHHLLGKQLLNKCHIHATSERERDAIKKRAHPKSITILPNFVKLPVDPGYAATQPYPSFKLLFFSRIEEKKGLDLLLNALASVTIPYRLTVAGEGKKDYVDYLKTIAVNNHISDKINWLGFYNKNKFTLLYGHDLFVLPSYDENFGNAVIESLGAGLPVLISEQVGLADYVKKNNLGWICQTTPASIGDAINEIVTDRQPELRRIRKGAPRIIHEDFNDDILVKKYINMYNKITKE